MSTRWHSPLTESRPPARPRPIDWWNLVPWGALLVFWVTIAYLVYWIAP